MLRRFADQHIDWRGRRVLPLPLLDDGLDRVTQELPDDVLHVAQNVRKGRVKMALDVYLGDWEVRPVSLPDELLCGLSTAFNDLPGVAPQEYLPHSLGLARRLSIGEMPW